MPPTDSPRRYTEIIAERIAGAEFEVVPDASHAVVIERPEEIVRIVREFVGGLG